MKDVNKAILWVDSGGFFEEQGKSWWLWIEDL